jgi:alkylhydroperoxidase family enzyme
VTIDEQGAVELGAEPRIPPLPLADWPAEMRHALAVLHPPNPRHPLLKRLPGQPKALNLLGTLARHPELTTAFHTFNGHILLATTLTIRQRELLVLRVAAVRGAEYEWRQHAVLAGNVGLDEDDVARIAAGPGAEGWSALDGAMVAAVDELLADAMVSDATWRVLAAELDHQQLLDLIFTVGTYDVIAMFLRSCRTPMDDDLRQADG